MHSPEEILNSIFRAAPVGIGVVVDRLFTQVNAHMCLLTGFSEQELVGRVAVGEQDVARFSQALATVLSVSPSQTGM